jgi:hypothetical protein
MLTPFLRSDAQGAVLAEVLLDPTIELTISEIARRAGVLLPSPTARLAASLMLMCCVTDAKATTD